MNAVHTAPLSELRQGLHVSVSQLRAWLACGRKYYFNYVVGAEPAHRPVALAFGTAIHKALEAYFEHQMVHGTLPPLDEVQTAFRDRWAVEARDPLPLLLDDGQNEGQVLDQGVALVGAFYQDGFHPDEVVAVELPFGMELVDPETGEACDVPLVGAIDLVARHQGRVWLIEHKTAARRFTADRIEFDFQPTSYIMAARQLGLPDPAAAFHVLLKTKKPSIDFIPLIRTTGSELEFIDTAFQVLKAIEAGSFPRNRGWACADCPFARRCGREPPSGFPTLENR